LTSQLLIQPQAFQEYIDLSYGQSIHSSQDDSITRHHSRRTRK
jgi:hypothetical protein